MKLYVDAHVGVRRRMSDLVQAAKHSGGVARGCLVVSGGGECSDLNPLSYKMHCLCGFRLGD